MFVVCIVNLRYSIHEVIGMIHYKLIQAFHSNNGILTATMAKQHGINDSTLRKASERNDIKKYSNGIYYLEDSYYDDFFMLQLKYPKGIFSHETAVLLHWLSTNYPFTYHISFPRGYHLGNAKDQNIKPYYLSEKELNNNFIQDVKTWDGNIVRVTNLEKTIVDMLRYNQSTPGVIEEMVVSYLEREDRDIDKLLLYARQFKVENLIEERLFTSA